MLLEAGIMAAVGEKILLVSSNTLFSLHIVHHG